ncbi:MAG: hypothetical protein UY18_C0030G0006 [Microgenomates group bacterium GW2011_GWF2_47_9]|nr:MAG: hypothetical protein UY18_C0030G0006 [Microgenomates group bacterium GW2011_GWF2_47_9]
MSSKDPAWVTTIVPVQRTLGDIRQLFIKHGCDNISFPENLKTGEIIIYFVYHGQPVSLNLNPKRMENRIRATQKFKSKLPDYIREQAARVTARQAFYYLKVTFECIETKLFSTAEALLAHFTTQSGERFIDLVGTLDPKIHQLLIEERKTL